MKLDTRITEALSTLKASDNYRFLREISSDGKMIDYQGKTMLNLSSNDYLGIGGNDELRKTFEVTLAANDWQWTAASSRLLSGNHQLYDELENRLKTAYGTGGALVFNSGYHANTGIFPALAQKGDVILTDKRVHASLIDGIRLSDAGFERYRHNDYNHLEKLLQKYTDGKRTLFVVTESVFSMDGDVADLDALVALKEKYGFVFYLDEAHGVGALGENGLGLAEEKGCLEQVDLLVGTFGKALASVGAYLVCSDAVRDYLVNRMRTLIFTTALPPVNLAWTIHVWDQLFGMKAQRMQLKNSAELLRKQITSAGFKTMGNSHIVPLMVGENAASLDLSEKLCDEGFFVLPVRYPTVPQGTARLRFSLRADVSEEEIEMLGAAIQ